MLPKRVIVSVFFMLALVLCGYCQAQPKGYHVFDDFYLSESTTLCGEPVPLANDRVRERLEREVIFFVCDRAQVFLWLKRAGRYFPAIEKQLAKNNLPDDLKYLAVAESSLLTYTQSVAGAVGPWQFMKKTAHENNLYNDRVRDERLCFDKSTAAALKHLQKLKNTFGSWTLAMAAYNCGEARVKNAVKEQTINDYYRLDLPMETERYIFKIVAIKIILQEPQRYGYRLQPDCVYRPLEFDSIAVDLRSPLHIISLAKVLDTDGKTLRDLNPHILSWYFPAGRYVLNVPPRTASKAQEAIRQATLSVRQPALSTAEGVYVVQAGETLGHIAQKTGIAVDTIKQLNNIDGSLIKAGQKLRLGP